MVVSKGGHSFDIVNFPGTDGGNVPCNVAYFTAEQTGQVLAGITSVVFNGRLCIRSMESS
jgi:hypothetical protein